MKQIILKICLITLLLIPSVVHAAESPRRGQATHLWDGKQDNKSIAELDLMTDRELAIEAHDVCLFGAIDALYHRPDLVIAAKDYLTLIGRIFRKKLNRELESMAAMLLAIAHGAQDDCDKALDKLYSEISKPTKSEGK